MFAPEQTDRRIASVTVGPAGAVRCDAAACRFGKEMLAQALDVSAWSKEQRLAGREPGLQPQAIEHEAIAAGF